jgi:hypothetical protein
VPRRAIDFIKVYDGRLYAFDDSSATSGGRDLSGPDDGSRESTFLRVSVTRHSLETRSTSAFILFTSQASRPAETRGLVSSSCSSLGVLIELAD